MKPQLLQNTTLVVVVGGGGGVGAGVVVAICYYSVFYQASAILYQAIMICCRFLQAEICA